jgi:hypothetical protein
MTQGLKKMLMCKGLKHVFLNPNASTNVICGKFQITQAQSRKRVMNRNKVKRTCTSP